MDSFSNRLRTLLNENNMTAVALSKACGISTSTLSQYLSGKYNPKSDRIEMLSDFFGCNPLWLAGKNVSPLRQSGASSLLPVYDSPPGRGSPAANIITYQSADSEYCDSDHYYLMIPDDTLAPCIEKEDTVLVELCDSVQPGDLGLFFFDEGKWSVREVLDNTNGLFLGFLRSSVCLPVLLTNERLAHTAVIGRILKIIKTWKRRPTQTAL